MSTLVAGSTVLGGRLASALAHGDPDGCIRLHERGARLLMDGWATEPTPAGVGAALQKLSVRVVIDANDPFVEGSSLALEAASADLGIPYRRVAPASFEEHSDAGRWQWVDTLDEAARAAWSGIGAPVVALAPIEICAVLGANGGRAGVAHRQRTPGELPFPLWLREPRRAVRVMTEAVDLIENESATVLLTSDSGDARVRVFLDASGLTGTDVVMVRRPPRWRARDGSGAVAREVLGALEWRNTVV